MEEDPHSSAGSVLNARPQSLAGAQALLHSNGDTSDEWDQLLTTIKRASKADMESSVLGQEHCHTHFAQKEPRHPRCTWQDCKSGSPGESTRAQEPTQAPMAGRGQQCTQGKEREPGADSSRCSEKLQ